MKSVNIKINQGTDFSQSVEVTDPSGNALSFANTVIYGGLRVHYESANVIPYTILTTNTGTIFFSLTHAQTSNLVYDRYVHDICMHDETANTIIRLVEGTAYVLRGVSPPQ